METLKTTPEITVLLPKKAFKDGSRNRLTQLMTDAGYNDAADGNMGRIDEITSQSGFYESESDVNLVEGEVCFRFVKDIGRLATQMRLMQMTGKPAISITGGDTMLEALLRVTQQIQGVTVEKVANLGIGKCQLEWLTPNENAAKTPEELSGRDLFSKYPELMRYLLQKSGVEARTFESEGADTNINDFRREGITQTGGAEIVGTGQTKIDLDLFGLPIDDDLSLVNDIKFSRITTDVFIINPQNISDRTRMAAMTVCDAFESAKPTETFCSIKVNIPRSKLAEIQGLNLGLVGPSVQEVVSNDRQDWIDVTLVVPRKSANGVSTRLKLIAGSEGSVSIGSRDIKSGGNADTSESIKYFAS